MPLFTVATITYNQEKWVRQAIESVLASSFTDFEYIIADDGSTDGTWEIIQSYQDPRIRSWQNQPNKGEYANRNDVLQKAGGTYILYVDGDDILYHHTLEEYARFAKAFPEANGIWCVYYHLFNFVVFPIVLGPQQLTRLNFLSRTPVSTVGLTETVFKVSALRSIGGFDSRYLLADTHAKRKLSCLYSMLLVPSGRSFWRQSSQQASQRAKGGMQNFVDTIEMDEEILYGDSCPLEGEELRRARFNFRNRRVKLVVFNTLRQGKLKDFFRLMKKLRVPYADLLLLRKSGYYDYMLDATPADPICNHYNFQKEGVPANL